MMASQTYSYCPQCRTTASRKQHHDERMTAPQCEKNYRTLMMASQSYSHSYCPQCRTMASRMKHHHHERTTAPHEKNHRTLMTMMAPQCRYLSSILMFHPFFVSSAAAASVITFVSCCSAWLLLSNLINGKRIQHNTVVIIKTRNDGLEDD